MGRLRAITGRVSALLQAEHLVGRGPQCALRLPSAYVSTQHALIRWTGTAWELVDRGSRNGTLLDDQPIPPGSGRLLSVGSLISFGHRDETWEVIDASAPRVSVVCLDAPIELVATDDVLGVPSDEDPACTVYHDLDGRWKLECPDLPLAVIEDGHVWEVGGMRWRFSCPVVQSPTETSEQALERRNATLCFQVSRDEEFVRLTVEDGRASIDLGARAHNYLLLLLARARLRDREAGHTEPSCGWLYKDDLAQALRVTPQQVDCEVHRIRKHFAQHGLNEASTIVDRRPRTRQLRLGVPSVRIARS